MSQKTHSSLPSDSGMPNPQSRDAVLAGVPAGGRTSTEGSGRNGRVTVGAAGVPSTGEGSPTSSAAVPAVPCVGASVVPARLPGPRVAASGGLVADGAAVAGGAGGSVAPAPVAAPSTRAAPAATAAVLARHPTTGADARWWWPVR